jgi:UDP-N-acetylmuramate dehydrogenase
MKLRSDIQTDVPLSRYTWMQTGGNADYFAVPRNLDDLVSLMRELKAGALPYFVIGQGTNLLFSDEGFRGCVIKLGDEFEKTCISGSAVQVGAATKLSTLVHQCSERSLSGIERLCGIPGSVGGAAATNAGAFGSHFSDVVSGISGVDASGNRVSLARQDVDFSYRRAVYPMEIVVTDIELKLVPGSRERLFTAMEHCLQKRRKRQPLTVPSAGCVFKNPSPDLPAGKLIEESGLKGTRLGDAMVSEKHANFIINTGHATTDEILSLIELIVERVRGHTGIVLETEVEVVR